MAEEKHELEMVELTDKQRKARRARNVAIAVALFAFVIIVYAGTWAKLAANLSNQ